MNAEIIMACFVILMIINVPGNLIPAIIMEEDFPNYFNNIPSVFLFSCKVTYLTIKSKKANWFGIFLGICADMILLLYSLPVTIVGAAGQGLVYLGTKK